MPLIGRWTHRAPARESAPLTRKLTSTIGLSDLALLAREPEGWRPLAVGDAPLAALLAADGLAALDPGCEGMAAGATLAAIPLAAPLAPLPLAGAAQSAI
ncbi:MAG: hypothetical protein HZY79_04845 [Rhodoblastus sp.]|nr:MAG: hypothetical protein HZY79_04845 [Rhodoblastus sp.]